MMRKQIKELGIIRAIKCAWQRATRGYDDTIFWGLDAYLRFLIEPLKELSEKELMKEEMEYNPERKEVYSETLKRIEALKTVKYEDRWKYPDAETELWKFVGEHIAWYWD